MRSSYDTINNMLTILYIIFAILGLIIGSFLNVVVLRLHTKRISKGRSCCGTCSHTLSTLDLVPVISYVCLMGRCRYCKLKISKQYPIVEIVTSLAFVGIFYRVVAISGGDITTIILYFIYFATIFSLLISMAVYDIKHFILPWSLMKIFLVFTFVGSIVIAFLSNNLSFLNFVSGFIVALPFWAIWYLSKGRLIGFGDILLMIGFGFMLGINGGYSATIFGFWIGALYFVLKMILTRNFISGKTVVPFGPFLIAGLYFTFLTGITLTSLVLGMV